MDCLRTRNQYREIASELEPSDGRGDVEPLTSIQHWKAPA